MLEKFLSLEIKIFHSTEPLCAIEFLPYNPSVSCDWLELVERMSMRNFPTCEGVETLLLDLGTLQSSAKIAQENKTQTKD